MLKTGMFSEMSTVTTLHCLSFFHRLARTRLFRVLLPSLFLCIPPLKGRINSPAYVSFGSVISSSPLYSSTGMIVYSQAL